jgi:hypothetical protein
MKDVMEKLPSDIQQRDEVWIAIAKELAQAGQWTQAIAAFDKIQKIPKSNPQRISVLQAWGNIAHQTSRSANQIADSTASQQK